MNSPNNDHVAEASIPYGKAPLMSEEEIEMTVRNSQAIEGYPAYSKEYEDSVEAFMKKHNVKVSD